MLVPSGEERSCQEAKEGAVGRNEAVRRPSRAMWGARSDQEPKGGHVRRRKAVRRPRGVVRVGEKLSAVQVGHCGEEEKLSGV